MKKYSGKYTREIEMPVGGIDTGSISIDGGGRLVNWQIFNRPSLGSVNGHSHFAVRAIKKGKIISAKALCGDKQDGFTGVGNGADARQMAAFSHFEKCDFLNRFPFGELRFQDSAFPGKVTLEAFNPLIPMDSENSSIPAAFFRVTFRNDTKDDLTYTAALSVKNPFRQPKNAFFEKKGCRGITLSSDIDKNDPEYGDITIASKSVTAWQEYWYRGGWQDPIVTFWREFSEDVEFKNRTYESGYGPYDTATILCDIEAPAGEKRHVDIVISWNVPTVLRCWETEHVPPEKMDEFQRENSWRNYYTKRFASSVESALFSCGNFVKMRKRTDDFAKILHGSTMPPEVIDAASSTLCVLKSPTCLRLSDGSFYGWEGIWPSSGSCEGTCQHVWNYAYALCFLFPDLERSVRELEFKYELRPDGKTSFRLIIPPEKMKQWDFRACVDGQMGCVIKSYREWKISGDDEWIKKHYDELKSILDYATSPENPDRWDADRDGVLEGRQHHTLDMELFGPSSWLEGFYLLALKAFADIAEYLGYKEDAAKYTDLFEKGSKWTEENLFNGEYYIQKIDLKDRSLTDSFGASDTYFNEEKGEIKYQRGDGCEIDQLLAQWHSDILGLGDIFDKKNRKKALKSLYKNNLKQSMRDFTNPWRVFALNDEKCTIICDYPKGAYKPVIPIPYCEETMHGFEYALAGTMIADGMVSEGLEIVRAVRDRYDGYKRNPFNEIECGNYYARSMASFALLPILSGFEFDMSKGRLKYDPLISEKGKMFKVLLSVGGAWGEYSQKDGEASIDLREGRLELSEICLPFLAGRKCLVTCDGDIFETVSDRDGTVSLGGRKKISQLTVAAK